MGMTAGGGSRAIPFINVTPLIDVLLVLLIIFMVITPLKPTRFEAKVPTQQPQNEQQNLKPNPLTLVVSITSTTDLRLQLNARPGENHFSPQAGEPCEGVVTDYGTVGDPSHMAQCLFATFQKRLKGDPPSSEKTVFIKAPRGQPYGDVVRVIDAIKGAGASPVGLQLDALQ